MQLAPQYGTDPVLTLDGAPNAIAAPAIRQRTRLLAALTGFDDEQWHQPSRCAGWTNRDVIVHLDSTNSFWAFSIAAGVRGEPTQFLTTFDPVASPAQFVEASDLAPADVLARFTASTQALIDAWTTLDDAGWMALAEAPPGHISVSAVTHHALWDSWVHERDILLPLGIAAAEEPDEIAASLRYAAVLGPALAITHGATEHGVLAIEATEPQVTAVIRIGDRVELHTGADTAPADLRLTGSAVELLEALSIRTPLLQHVPAATAWMIRGLSETFDVRTA
jgi:uncharacterized protein (TIGR03083 family)